jgi:hypothetical protein
MLPTSALPTTTPPLSTTYLFLLQLARLLQLPGHLALAKALFSTPSAALFASVQVPS